VEIEGFGEALEIIGLAKELHDTGRRDIIESRFCDTLCGDSWLENVYGTIESVFSEFLNSYDDNDETEAMVFSDGVISDYYRLAAEYGRSRNIPYEKNPFVIEAEREARRLLGFCCSMDFKLLGYTKTPRTAKRSKLIVFAGVCACDCQTGLAYGLLRLRRWFSDKVAESERAKEVRAACVRF
jgi:hypothetical protein